MKPAAFPRLATPFLAAALAFGASLHAAEPAAPGSLQQQLDQRKADFEKSASADKIREYDEGVAAVRDSGILEKAINEGDQAPDFTLKNATGKAVQLSELLADGPVVLTWYRGGWCPYCNLALRSLQKHLPEIEATGAQLVALTPELPDKSLDTAEKADLSFQVLTDLNNEVARKYGLVFKMTQPVEEAMRKFANLKSYNGDDYTDSELPLAATYIVDTDGTVYWAFLDAEYRNRAEPAAIIAALKRLKSAAADND